MIITGEGKLDVQTFSGNTIQGIMSYAKAKQIKVAAFCVTIDLDENSIKEFGIHYADAVLHHSKNLDDAIKNECNYLKDIAKEFAKKLV